MTFSTVVIDKLNKLFPHMKDPITFIDENFRNNYEFVIDGMTSFEFKEFVEIVKDYRVLIQPFSDSHVFITVFEQNLEGDKN